MKDCIFCKIIKGELPSSKIYETDKVLAFLDIAPVHSGHALVVPKMHYETLLDMPNSTASDVIIASKKVTQAIIEAINADGANVGFNNYAAAGQVVFHSHMHIIPRFLGDGLKQWPQGKYNDGEMQKVCQQIKKKLA